MAEAARAGKPYQERLDPPPADPRVVHPDDRKKPAGNEEVGVMTRKAGGGHAKKVATVRRQSRADILARDLGDLIDAARRQVAQVANAVLTTLQWEIGTRIRQAVLKERRAGYGA